MGTVISVRIEIESFMHALIQNFQKKKNNVLYTLL